jgi:uncharacterized membrane protein YkoI
MKALTTAMTVIGAFAIQALGAETEVPFAKLPGSVQKATTELVGKGKIVKTTSEPGDHGGTIYEVAYTIGRTKYEAEISPKGKVLVVDQQISLSQAPKPVRKAIEDNTAGGKILKIEKATEGKKVFYEAEFTKGGGEHEVKVAPDGKILARE